MIVYLDTSSVIKLYLGEEGADDVRQLVSTATSVTTAAIAYAETRATLARYGRSRRLASRAFAEARRLFELDWERFVSIELTNTILRNAGDLAERHGLRGFDSIHLASFVQVLERSTHDDVEFSSFDERLNKAAKKLR